MRQTIGCSVLAFLLLAAPAAASADGAADGAAAALPDAPVPVDPARQDDAVVTGAPTDASCSGPPCGWIDPILDLRFPDKRPCDARLGQQPDPDACHALQEGEELVLEGTVVWWWDISQDGTYPLDPSADITISFGPTARDPPGLPFTVEPASFTISNVEMADPANYRQEETEGSVVPRTLFWFERPVTLTIQRTGMPTGDDAELAEQRGFESVFIRAHSTESGDRFRASFGIEEVRFVVGGVPSNDAPLPLLPVMAMVVAAAVWRRGRQGPAP